jgi:hypothetical protein
VHRVSVSSRIVQRMMPAAMLAKVYFRAFRAQRLADMTRQPAIRHIAD